MIRAAGSLFHQLGYPQHSVANLSNKSPELIKRCPMYFSFLGTPSHNAEAVANPLNDLTALGKIGKKLAFINVDDRFDLEFSEVARKKFHVPGFELVYERGYPLGTADFQTYFN